ncbi:MAG: ABC transporter ATP-binding protein, partial [Acidimicrobiia bacterium]
MLSVEHLTVRFGSQIALDAVDLSVATGEIVCVLGPSGSGKSTLLRAVAGLEPLAAGRVVRDGVDLAGVPPQQRGLGLMFQDHTLFPHRDVLGNVAFGPRMHGATRSDAARQASATLELVGLAGFERRRVDELSGGEQQRVALARALAPAPALLMLDEPLGALDRRLRERLVDDIGALFRELGQSVLFVTHDHDEAFGLADRVAILHAGRVEQVGAPTELWRAPATAFVAEFLGWNVVALDGDGSARAIRPDALHLDPSGALEGVVVARTFRRDHWRVRIELTAGAGRGGAVDVVLRDPEPPAID